MQGFAFKGLAAKGLAAALVAGAALAFAAPTFAADYHARYHGQAHGVMRAHGLRAHVVRAHRYHSGAFRHLTVVQRDHWRRGHWWHGRHHGRFGWWWNTGGIWYWYPEPVYPYPTYISTAAAYDYAPEGYSEDSWYYCSDPEGYYPYVRNCNAEWRPVPISPQARNETLYGTPPESSESDEDTDNDADYGGDNDEY